MRLEYEERSAPQPSARLVGDCRLCNCRHTFLHCKKHKIFLQMIEGRGLYCPKCNETSSGNPAEFILCCVECEKPLAVTEGEGSYCLNCNFHPSMQDTFLWKIEKISNPT